ncbi:MAG: Holliday junction branch migration protein RuvA [Firmicutes bacterium]|jgi:Holliday junction DNA helicase RuvA|nr:Holliday junction branch migration protein RuvA [Bacillota bacterium]
MIDYIKGVITEKEPGWITVGVGGVGVKIDVPLSYFENNSWQPGTELHLFTRLIIREDGVNLYGFSTSEERILFDLITSVPGFGPRLGLSVLGTLPARDFYGAILESDIETLCIVPGIGKKLAQRLILELREKMQELVALPAAWETSGISKPGPREEALRALSNLGYSRSELLPVLNLVLAEEETPSTEDLVKLALKKLASR